MDSIVSVCAAEDRARDRERDVEMKEEKTRHFIVLYCCPGFIQFSFDSQHTI